MKFYDSKKWIHMRDSVMRAAEYKDQLEARQGRNVPAEVVHHIFPREKYPEYELCRWNLIAISRDTHERLHNRFGEDLSFLGWELLQETAQKQGIPISKMIMVVGLPGSGKTTWTKQHMKNAVAYDMDYIAAAFRLRQPHEERHEPARRMAALMMRGFVENAKKYSGVVYVIRSLPTAEEISEIMPDVVICCKHEFDISRRKDFKNFAPSTLKTMEERIREIKEYCDANRIVFEEV